MNQPLSNFVGQRAMMRRFFRLLRNLRHSDAGVTAMEYGLIAAATVVTISIFMPGVSTRLSGIFSKVSNAL